MSATEAETHYSRRRRLIHPLILIVTIICLLGFGSENVSAAETDAIGSLELADQTSWVTGSSPFVMRVRPQTNRQPDQVELVATVFGAVRSRSQFQQSIDGQFPGSSIVLDRHELNEVLGPDGLATISLPVQDAAQKRFYIRSPGVYPVRVDLRDTETGDVLDQFVTHLINQPQAAPVKLGVATVLPVQSPQSMDTSKPFMIDDAGRSVTTIAQALAGASSVPIAVVAEPESLERLQLPENDPTRSVNQQLAAAVGSREVIRTTWTPVQSSMYDSELAFELNRQFERGEASLRSVFPDITTDTWAATELLDANGLAALTSRGVRKIIVREQDLTASQRSTALTRPFVLSSAKSGKENVTAAQADSGLADHFADAEGSALGAHRLLADLSVLWNDHPGNQRSVVVMPPRNWMPDATFLRTFLDGMSSSPVLSAVDLNGVFSTPFEGGAKSPLSQRLTTPSKTQTQGYPTSEMIEQRRRLNALSSIAPQPNATVDEIDTRLLIAQRADLDNGGHKDWLAAAGAEIDRELSGIRLPDERSIRLTARQGEIPVTVQNDNGYPVKVRVRLTAGKLDFPAGDERVIDATRQYVTERFEVETRTSGAFAVQVQLESPDGSIILQKSEITVRSTATSAIGLGLSGGAIAFLILWWVRSAIKNRRAKVPAT